MNRKEHEEMKQLSDKIKNSPVRDELQQLIDTLLPEEMVGKKFTSIEEIINIPEMVEMDEKSTEEMIQEKGLNAPRLTPDHIDSVIAEEYYHIVPGTTMTICALTLQNGFQVTGESAAVSLENFDEEIGRKVARENARDQIWKLEGYLLKQRLYNLQREKEAVMTPPLQGSEK